MKEQTLALNDRVQVIGAWPRNAKGIVQVIVGGSKPIVRVDFDHSHRVEGYDYRYQWYHPTQIQRIGAQEG